jgi:hypothetical protein
MGAESGMVQKAHVFVNSRREESSPDICDMGDEFAL